MEENVVSNIYHIVSDNDTYLYNVEYPLCKSFYEPVNIQDIKRNSIESVQDVMMTGKTILTYLLTRINSQHYTRVNYISYELLQELNATGNDLPVMSFTICNPKSNDVEVFKITYNGKEYVIYGVINPFEFLKRDYTDPLDIKYNDQNRLIKYIDDEYCTFEPSPKKDIYNVITCFMDELKMYETINTNFHSGNLYHHSIWALLYSEHITSGESKFGDMLKVRDIKVRKLTCFISLIHDIGKMVSLYDTNNIKYYKSKFIYKGIRNHLKYGALIMSDTIDLYSTECGMKFNIKRLLLSFGIIDFSFVRCIISLVSELHTKFGINVYKKVSSDKELMHEASKDYVKLVADLYSKYLCKVDKYFPTFITILLVISISDIAAMQPFIEHNTVSEFYPFIQNVPKLYKGVNIYNTNNFYEIVSQSISIILNIVHSMEYY